ncbi:DUF3102 domain-containing protein [Lysobacter sp. CA196]|uniref:DUF3102 domain-containing protein n=1 Tax=Lysobacter sp. CA196 TaxID=3455606 RepID=UPI003F8D8D68
MARAKNQPANAIETPVVSADTTQQQNQMAVITGQIAEQFGDGMPYERGRIVNETRFYIAQSCEAMLEVGKRLIQIKENEPHGEFVGIVEGSLGIEARVARRMMQAAVKYLGADVAGAAKRSALSVLGKTKLYELMVLDDEELDALADGGTVAGLRQDEIDRMSSRELREALRKAKQERAEDRETHGRLLAKKDERINQLDRKLAEAETAKQAPNRREAERQDAEAALLAKLQNSAMKLYGEIAPFAQDVADCLEGAPSDSSSTAVTTTVQWLFQRINEVALAHTIPVDFAEMVTPSWMRDAVSANRADTGV